MADRKMHPDEVDTSASLVARLLRTQFPQWADLPIRRFASTGTTSAIYRLGADMAIRLPRTQGATAQVDKEHRWLHRLAPHLPLAVPVPLARGEPGEGYPWSWSVYRWLAGENAIAARITDLRRAALDLAGFITALQRIDPSGGPPAGAHNLRGVPLSARDDDTRQAIAALNGLMDTDAVTEVWETALRAPQWDRATVWFHGDILPGNLLVERGRITGVIDYGSLGVGDPACDLMIAWNLFAGESRDAFRVATQADEAMWVRGRGHALSQALIYIPYYLETNPVGVAVARRAIDEILWDFKQES